MTFSTTDLSRMRDTQEAHMNDVCKIGRRLATEDAYGAGSDEITWGGSQICGLDLRQGSYRRGSDIELVIYDATLRLPHGTLISTGDKVSIISRFGEEQDPPLPFEVMSPLQDGPSGMRVALKRAR